MSGVMLVMAPASGRREPVTNDSNCVESVAADANCIHACAMRLIRIDHVSLDVHDRPAAIAWYEDVLGLRAQARHDVPDEPVFLGPPGARLGLFADRGPGLRHVALATDRAGQ